MTVRRVRGYTSGTVPRFWSEMDLFQHSMNLKSQLLPTWITKDLYQEWSPFLRWQISKNSQFKLSFNIPWKFFCFWKSGGRISLWCSGVGATSKLCCRWATFENIMEAFLIMRGPGGCFVISQGPSLCTEMLTGSQSHMAQGIQVPRVAPWQQEQLCEALN